MLAFDQQCLECAQVRWCDLAVANVQAGNEFCRCENCSGCADSAVPTVLQQTFLDRLELALGSQARLLECVDANASVAEVFLRHGYATHMQAFSHSGLEAPTKNELG